MTLYIQPGFNDRKLNFVMENQQFIEDNLDKFYSVKHKEIVEFTERARNLIGYSPNSTANDIWLALRVLYKKKRDNGQL